MLHKLLLSVLLTLYSVAAFAQSSLQFEHFTVQEGLSQNVIYCVFQDSRGFLWMGTHNGLNRYDGYEFVKYYNNPFDENSLQHNSIYAIEEDSQKKIWVLSAGGLHAYNYATQKFQRYALPPELVNTAFTSVPEMMRADSTSLLIKFSSGVFLFDYIKKIFQQIDFENTALRSDEFANKALTKTPAGDILIAVPGSKTSLYYYDAQRKIFTNKLPAMYKCAQDDKAITTFIFDKQSNFFALDNEWHFHVCHPGGIVRNINLKPFINNNTPVFNSHCTTDNDGMVWISTGEGLIEYDFKNDKLKMIQHNPDLYSSLSSNVLTALYLDHSGNLWAGTYGAGINKCNVHKSFFTSFTQGNTPRISLPGKFIYSVREDEKQNLYTCFYDAAQVTVINPERTEAISYPLSHFEKQFSFLFPEFSGLKLPDSVQKQITKGKFRSRSNPNIFIDSKKNIWLRRGTYLCNLNTQIRFNLPDIIEALSEDSLGNFWIGTSNEGLHYINTSTRVITHFTSDVKQPASLSSNTVNAIVQDIAHNCLWLATGYGLNRFDIITRTAKHFTDKDGLCNNSIYSIIADDKGHLWMGTGNGLSCFDIAAESFVNYNKADGLINIEYNRNAAMKTISGELIFGGTEGLDIFKPALVQQNSEPPVVSFTSFSIMNKEQSLQENPITLEYDKNNISFSFAVMDFSNPSKNKFAYTLAGADTGWTLAGARHTVSYASLLPGNYIFKVKGANADGVWNATPVIFQFTILPPWWQTGWFYALCALAIISGVYALFRYRLQHLIKLLQLRQRIHRDLHDDVGATLSTVKVYSEMLKENPARSDFVKLINENANEMLEKLEVIIWASKPENDNMHSLIEKMKEQSTALFYHKGIDLNFETDERHTGIELPGTVRQNLFLIFKEAANNIIKYANCTTCNISMRKTGHRLVMTIRDDGVGMNTQQAKGNGLYNMQYRAKELSGECIIRTAEGKGTEVKVLIPFPFKIVEIKK